VALARLGVQVDRGDGQGPVGKLNLRGDRSLAADTLFARRDLVDAIGQRNAPDPRERIAAEDGVAMQPNLVFAFDAPFDSLSLGEVQVTRNKGVVEPQLPRQFLGDRPVARPGHADIALGQ